MPSAMHEALLLLFRNRPELAPELLKDALGVEIPSFLEARLEDTSFVDLQPAEYRADLVVLLENGVPVLAIVVEVQLSRDLRKRFTWPVYVTGLRARLECPACVLVVTTEDSVAEWARTPIELGPGFAMAPYVIGPSSVPIVRDVAVARGDPELAVLSVMAHGKGATDIAMATAEAAYEAAHDLDEDRRLLYFDLIRHSLGAAARKTFEDLMRPAGYEYQSDFARKYFGEGKAEGKAEGNAEGKAESIVLFLTARGLSLSSEQEMLIRECRDQAELARWLGLAAVAATAAELFAEPPRSS